MSDEICDRCFQPLSEGEHGRWLCPLEPRRRQFFPNVHGDEIDYVDHNIARDPIHFTSKSERRRMMKQLGLQEKVEHVGYDGTDKSKHTTRWV